MFDSAFVTAARNRHAEGVISYDEMMQCVEGAQNREGMVRARRYFIPAMKVILPIIIMMLDTNPCPDED
jgi:hypothetical protein